MDPNLLSGSVLTYIGDSYYEHKIRSYLVNEGLTKLNDLHSKAITYTSGKAQAKIIQYLINEKLLTEIELSIYKRGRNISVGSKKHLKLTEVNDSNGFEALIGYLSLKEPTRADVLINYGIKYIKRENGKN